MSFIAAGIAGAGLAAQFAGPLLANHSTPQPFFDPGYDNRFGPDGVTGKERARQAELQAKADAVNKTELGRYDNIQGQSDAKAKTLADFFAANSSALPTSGPTAPGAMPVSHSKAVLDDAVTKMGRVSDFNTQQNGGLAKLRSFGDVWNDIGVGLTGDRSTLSNISNARAGDAALMPFELQAAYRPPSYGNTPAPPDNTLADLLTGAGKVATSVGLSGWNPFGSGFSGTPAGLSTYGSPGYAATTRYGGPK